jgi:hypothetical protein
MTSKHGNRVYVQLLLERGRGALLLEECKQQGIKPSEFIRILVYKWLKAEFPEEEAIAHELDKLDWQAAVQSRLDGRARNRANALKTSDQSEQAS